MNKPIESIKKFFKVLELSKTFEIECPVCHTRWIAPKKDIKKGAGLFRLLDHEYSHLSKLK